MKNESQSSPVVWYRARNGRLLLLLLGMVGVYALIEHWAHALPYLPWLLILACPLMHVFMHRGHGRGHGGHGSQGGHGSHGGQRERNDEIETIPDKDKTNRNRT